MATVYLAPTFGAGYQAFDSAGLPLNAGLIYTYIAGGTTPQATYTTSTGNVANANPIVLGADGRTPSEVWLLKGQSYRFDVKDSAGNLLKTYDNLSGINDLTAAQTGSPTYLTNVAGTNTITANATPTLTAYTTGQRFYWQAANTNTGATTMNIDSVGAAPLVWSNSPCIGNEIVQNKWYETIYDGSSLQIIGASTAGSPGGQFFDSAGGLRIRNTSDATKQVRWDVSAITTGTNRILTVRDADFTIGTATAAEQEAGASASVSVTPSIQQRHPSAAKFWAQVTVSAGTPTLAASYNVTSITDTGTGLLTVTIATDFSSVNWCCQVSVERASTALAVANLRYAAVRNTGQAAGTVLVECWDGTAATALQVDPATWHVSGFGDQ